MSENYLTIQSEKFQKDENSEPVEGLTIIIDGKVKQVFDKIKLEKGYNSYSEILRDAIFNGINTIIKK
ncbi:MULTISPECIES: hypothetical protein [Clostridium]|uniref:CopG family transcriptional regulator n=1 Tax=Clostridium frigoriphilum TaxID=443253 RepID=A0ABU7UVC1_9CLOT|nr:hypothetical protein [Clostridium sp. DSM 17811]MBU3102439.1 hypothetical protein [Clostridium sp. DSM 17811]